MYITAIYRRRDKKMKSTRACPDLQVSVSTFYVCRIDFLFVFVNNSFVKCDNLFFSKITLAGSCMLQTERSHLRQDSGHCLHSWYSENAGNTYSRTFSRSYTHKASKSYIWSMWVTDKLDWRWGCLPLNRAHWFPKYIIASDSKAKRRYNPMSVHRKKHLQGLNKSIQWYIVQ